MKLNLKNTLKISLAFGWISIFANVFDSILPIILTAPLADGGFSLNNTEKGVVMALDNILGLFLLPLFGFLSDRCKSSLGKRTPYIVLGTSLATVFWALAGVALKNGKMWWFLGAICCTLTSMAMLRPAALSLLPDVTLIMNRRKANAITNIVSVIATLVGIIIVTLVFKYNFYLVFFVSDAAILIVFVIFLFTVRENALNTEYEVLCLENKEAIDTYLESIKPQDNLQNKKKQTIALLISVFFFYVSFNGLVSSLSNYAIEVLGLSKNTFTLPQLLCLLSTCLVAVPVSKLSTKIGRKWSLFIALITMLIAFVIAWSQKGMTALMVIAFVLAGIGYSIAIVNYYPYFLELCDQNKIGKSTGVFNNAMMIAMIITPILSGILQDKIFIEILFPYCSCALVLSAVAMLFIKEPRRM